MRWHGAILAGLLASLALGGCGQRDVAEFRAAHAALADGAALPDSAFQAEITFCRRVGSKSGRRFDVGDVFVQNDERRDRNLHAFVDVRNAPVGRHQVHLVWLRPDGHELFRKFAEVSVAPAAGGWRTTVTWKDAVDLDRADPEQPVVGAAADFTLASRLGVSPEREREPGDYAVRFYWNRELMCERAFHFDVPGWIGGRESADKLQDSGGM